MTLDDIVEIPCVLEDGLDSGGHEYALLHTIYIAVQPTDPVLKRLHPDLVIDAATIAANNARRLAVAIDDYSVEGQEFDFAQKINSVYAFIGSRSTISELKDRGINPLVQFVRGDSYVTQQTIAQIVDELLAFNLEENHLSRFLVRRFDIGRVAIEERPRIFDLERHNRRGRFSHEDGEPEPEEEVVEDEPTIKDFQTPRALSQYLRIVFGDDMREAARYENWEFLASKARRLAGFLGGGAALGTVERLANVSERLNTVSSSPALRKLVRQYVSATLDVLQAHALEHYELLPSRQARLRRVESHLPVSLYR